MEDRYLFKAKRLDNEEWVEGALIYDNKDELYRIITEIDYSTGTCVATEKAPRIERFTACQCTGLKDKNGKLIWENDIMVAHLDDHYPEDKTYAKIRWRKNGFYVIENGSEDISPIDKFDQDHFEVCGNVFDNKELLESEE
nr:MAG TPA: YopX protein [Bacteriophage sp.]